MAGGDGRRRIRVARETLRSRGAAAAPARAVGHRACFAGRRARGVRSRCVMESAQPSQQRRILAVDDEPRSLRVIARLLEQAHLYCHTVSTGEEALTFLKSARELDVVVTDLRMPSMDGIEFMRTLRRVYADRPWLQMILITGQASIDAAVAAIRLEASDFLFKPIEPKRLREAVQKALERAAKARAVHRSAITVESDREDVRELEDTARRLALR